MLSLSLIYVCCMLSCMTDPLAGLLIVLSSRNTLTAPSSGRKCVPCSCLVFHSLLLALTGRGCICEVVCCPWFHFLAALIATRPSDDAFWADNSCIASIGYSRDPSFVDASYSSRVTLLHSRIPKYVVSRDLQ
jgi:hypothetical protein